MVVFNQDMLAIRRPSRTAEESSRRQRHRTRRCDAGWFSDHQLIFTARIRKPCDLRTIRRPHRIAIVRARALREIAKVTFLRGHGENLAASFEGGASSGWGE